MKNDTITIYNQKIYPGEQVSIALPLPELFSCAPMYMPIKVIHGKQAGPCLLVISTMQGDQLNGTEIINRLLQLKNIKKLKGTLIAVPIMNVYGFVNRTRTMPGGITLDNNFPGSAHDSIASRLAYLFCSEIFPLADYCINLQTGGLNYSNLPQIFITTDEQRELALAHAFSAPVIYQTTASKNSLRAYANKKQIPYLVYEAGEAMRFDESSIVIGIKGIINVMRHINMLSYSSKTNSVKHKSLVMHDMRWIRSPTSGVSNSTVKLGQQIKKNELLAILKDPFGSGSDIQVKAPFVGIIVSINNLPLVYEGVPLFQLATFEKLSFAASHLEDWIAQSEYQSE